MDGAGNLYVTGSSFGPGWPTVNARQATHGGGEQDCVVAALRRTGGAIGSDSDSDSPGGVDGPAKNR